MTDLLTPTPCCSPAVLERLADIAHIDTLSHLPLHHRDPFDRLMIAQAVTEGMTMVSRDGAFADYAGLELLRI